MGKVAKQFRKKKVQMMTETNSWNLETEELTYIAINLLLKVLIWEYLVKMWTAIMYDAYI